MTDSHWLHRVVPDTYEDATFLTWLPWMLFGNDEGGVFGERDPYHTILGNPVSYSLGGFLKWWIRNPLHNLFFHVLRWDCGDNALVLYARDETGSRWWFRARRSAPGTPTRASSSMSGCLRRSSLIAARTGKSTPDGASAAR